MNFMIKVRYTTGSSFTSEDVDDYLAPVWKTQEDAYKALFELHAFNEYYMAYENEVWTPEKQKKVLELARKHPWAGKYSTGHPWDFNYGMDIHHESGRIRVCTRFITGYFERLISADVVVDLKSSGSWDRNIDLEDLEKKYAQYH